LKTELKETVGAFYEVRKTSWPWWINTV